MQRGEKEKKQDISFRFRDKRKKRKIENTKEKQEKERMAGGGEMIGEEENAMCLTDGGETRCHVAFRDLVALKLPVFLLSSLSASIFPPTTTLAALYRGLDSHRSAKGECPQMQTTSFVTAIYSPLFSTEIIFLNDTP